MNKHPRPLLSFYSEELQLLIACKMGKLDEVKRLVQGGRVDPSFLNNKPLETACENGRDDIGAFLLTQPGVTFAGNNALQLANQYGHVYCARLATPQTQKPV